MSSRVPLLITGLLLLHAAPADAQRLQSGDLWNLRSAAPSGSEFTAHATVTCVERTQFYLQDYTDAFVFLYPKGEPAIQAGDFVKVTGIRRGAFPDLQLQATSVVKVGTRVLPEAPLTAIGNVITTLSSNFRMRVRGSVHDVAVDDDHIILHVVHDLAGLTVKIPAPPGERPVRLRTELLDAVVEVTGISIRGGTHPDNTYRPWSVMPVASLADLKVLTPGRADIFDAPVITLADLRKSRPAPLAGRFRVGGVVTYASKSGWFYFQDGTGTARGRKPDLLSPAPDQRREVFANTDLNPGDVIELVGQLMVGHEGRFMPVLIQCEWRVVRREPPPDYPLTDVADIFKGDFNGRPVSLNSKVLSFTTSNDPNGYINHYVNLTNCTALVQLQKEQEVPLKANQYVRLRGVVQASLGMDGATTGFRMNVSSFDDIMPIRFALDRLMVQRWLLGGVAAAAAGAIWIFMLRRQVRRQTSALRRSNEELARFKQVADTTTDLVAMASLDQVPLYFNPAGRAMLGIDLDEDASAINFSSIYTPETLELFQREGFSHAFQHGHWNAEITMVHRDGHEIPVSFVGLILHSPDGQPLCLSCIARDISIRKKMEQNLRQSLEHERELNELKSSFVNTISHEFRTPLGIILFAASMLRRFDARYGPAERAQQLKAIEDAVSLMNDLVEQSLNLGRAEAAETKSQTVDLEVLCRRVIDEVQSSTSHATSIRLETEGASQPAISDPALLRAILGNLLGNAVKYSPAGSPVVLRLACVNDQVTFTVRDQGPGLRAEDLPHLFTTFYRGANAPGIPGSGLGLAIVKRCAEALGGSVAARNAEGGGAEFTVTLPLIVPSLP